MVAQKEATDFKYEGVIADNHCNISNPWSAVNIAGGR